MTEAGDPRYAALNVPALADGQSVVLAIRPSDSVVVALSPEAARELWAAGMLRGWEPSP